jgi:hypothetical protein
MKRGKTGFQKRKPSIFKKFCRRFLETGCLIWRSKSNYSIVKRQTNKKKASRIKNYREKISENPIVNMV